jgi:outer membrane protein TolC
MRSRSTRRRFQDLAPDCRAINRWPGVRQAEEQPKSADYSVESARAAFFPTISLTRTLG